MERKRIALVQCRDVAWGGPGWALGRAVGGDEARQEGQVHHGVWCAGL